MSRRSLLNVTSRKKQDTMLTYTNATSTNRYGGSYNTIPAVLQASSGAPDYEFLFVATARTATPVPNTFSNINDTASRTATRTFMRGIKERIEVQTSDGTPWQWRRICFTYKGPTFINSLASYLAYAETSNGYVRPINDLSNQPGVLHAEVFDGVKNTDWNDTMIAPLDRTRIRVMYDKCYKFQSGNNVGVMKRLNLWHPMNKTLVYDDEEQGGGIATNSMACNSNVGMGDYYIYDIVRPLNGVSGAQMSVNIASTLYWHER